MAVPDISLLTPSAGKDFTRLTDPLPVAVEDLRFHDLIHSKSFHFFGTAAYIKEQTEGIMKLLQKTLLWPDLAKRPFMVFEPVANNCSPSTLDEHLEAAKCVDVYSPNHEELASFFGVEMPLPSDKLIIRKQAQVFLDAGIGPEGKGCMLVRCAEAGCLVLSRGRKPAWFDAYYAKDSDAVVDPTGAGNAFLGAFAIGWLKTTSYIEAARYGTVAASFMLEQHGCPVRSGEGNEERWNGVKVEDRMKEYSRREIGM
jgi:sugar/nucleoside kinase (ribokinase family)